MHRIFFYGLASFECKMSPKFMLFSDRILEFLIKKHFECVFDVINAFIGREIKSLFRIKETKI